MIRVDCLPIWSRVSSKPIEFDDKCRNWGSGVMSASFPLWSVFRPARAGVLPDLAWLIRHGVVGFGLGLGTPRNAWLVAN